jgi:prepilin-type N-terminal cleavage/methylation domain-containing protein
MKTHSCKSSRRGFTLVELLVAMAITTVIILVLVGVTSVAVDTWKRSRSEVRAASQGKAMIDSMARDLEALVVRTGNTYQWLHAETPSTMPGADSSGKIKEASTNALDLEFFTSVTDRYNGGIGTSDDQGGDISGVGYKLVYEDPLTSSSNSDYGTFALHRILVDPDDTYKDLLGKTDLHSAFQPYDSGAKSTESFICENVYQFTVTFLVEISRTSGQTTNKLIVPVTMGDNFINSLQVNGDKIVTAGSVNGASSDEISAGRIVGAQISLTVLTDFGLEQLRVRPFANDADRAKFFAKNAFQYSKMINLPGK